jgi:nitrogen fixation NifU-like protein
MDNLRSLHEEIILDHNRHPRNYPLRPDGTNRSADGLNALCGDEFRVYCCVRDGMIKDIGFEGAGCAVSTASCSLMTEAVKGKSITEAQALFKAVHEALTGEGETIQDSDTLLGKLSVLVSVREYPMRVKCATLAWHMLRGALECATGTVRSEDEADRARACALTQG